MHVTTRLQHRSRSRARYVLALLVRNRNSNNTSEAILRSTAVDEYSIARAAAIALLRVQDLTGMCLTLSWTIGGTRCSARTWPTATLI